MGALRNRLAEDVVDVDTEGSWAVSYGDMITLLVCFFILFFATDRESDRKKEMETKMLTKLQALGEPSTSQSQGDTPHLDESLMSKFQVQTHKVGEKIIVEFPNTSFFAFGKIDISKDGNDKLKKFVDTYMPYAGNYILGIRAYTDNKKVIKSPHRRFNDNLELSALRAVSTMRSLQKMGIPLNRMRLGGFGELRMTEEDLKKAVEANPTYSKDGLALARKVVLVIEPEPRERL